uniref:Uncharacterized protein n=1 Tax=Parascaris equorum TaxID=6256 RepID=A0A914R9R7_PAREQ
MFNEDFMLLYAVFRFQFCDQIVAFKFTMTIRFKDYVFVEITGDIVRERVSQSGFLLDADGVDIMSGTDEGVFSWFTLNVLTDRLQHIIRPDQNGICMQIVDIRVLWINCLINWNTFLFLLIYERSSSNCTEPRPACILAVNNNGLVSKVS